MARLDALPNQVATTLVFVIGIIAGIAAVIKTGIETKAKSAAAKASATETAVAKAMTTAATMTAPAATTTGQGCRAGCTQQERRCAERTEGIAAEQNHRGQLAAQGIAARFSVLVFSRSNISKHSH